MVFRYLLVALVLWVIGVVAQTEGKPTTVELVQVLCDTPSWTLVDTLITLPLFGNDAFKASKSSLLQRFSPVEGNLSVRSLSPGFLPPPLQGSDPWNLLLLSLLVLASKVLTI